MKKFADLLVQIMSFEVLLMVLSRLLFYSDICSFDSSNKMIDIVFIWFGITAGMLVILLIVHHFTDKPNKY